MVRTYEPGIQILAFPLFLKVFPLQRPRATKHGVFSPLKNQIELRTQLRDIRTFCISERFFLETHFFFKTKVKHATRSDLDNLLKALLDGLQAEDLISDDKMCVGITATKNPAGEDFCYVKLSEAICKQNTSLDITKKML